MLFDERIAFKKYCLLRVFLVVSNADEISLRCLKIFKLFFFIFVRYRIHVFHAFFPCDFLFGLFLSKNVNFCDVLWSHWHIRYVNLLLLFEDLFEMCVNVFL